MNKLVYKVTTAVSTAALLTGSVASVAFGSTTVTVSGNGADSNNEAKVNVTTSKSIYQTNTADIQNNVNINANSGDNTANKNTGGDVSISTGDANVSSSVSNSANSNAASLSCGTCAGNTDVKISGNGADSKNKVDLDLDNTTKVYQSNEADVRNNVKVDANTGGNKANKNTGGDVEIETGDADVTVDVTNAVNQNVATIGGGAGGSLSAEISGNGADSKNDLKLNLDNDVEILQENVADIKNSVDVDANSGDNQAKKNTGGDVSIDTGDADVNVEVTNKANFNGLDLSDCSCEMDAEIKIAGNGADSENKADITLASILAAAQTNDFDCDGGRESQGLEIFGRRGHKGGDCAGVKVDSSTGGNKANENTQSDSDDPAITTGDAGGDVVVSTEANSNVIGDMGGLTLPHLPSNMNGWLVLLMGMMSSH